MPGSSHSITAASALPVTRYNSVQEVIETLQPDLPVYALHPQDFRRVATAFQEGFPGQTMYAVKANHALPVLDMVHAAGINRFDVVDHVAVEE